MGKKLAHLVCVGIFLISFTSCSKESVCDTPFGTGGKVDLYMSEFAALQTVGGSLTINRGYKGIFVRRASLSEFVAFECACPHCHEVGLQSMAGWEGGVLECPECGSHFETVNGDPLQGSATSCSLYQYYTYFDGYNILEIY